MGFQLLSSGIIIRHQTVSLHKLRCCRLLVCEGKVICQSQSRPTCYVSSFFFFFSGIISRQDAENLLVNKPPGSFLVRVSERVWGYTITYRAPERCKHYLVDTSENTYQFFGHNQIAHETLKDLVEFHKQRPITGVGQELLKIPCGQDCNPPDYQELLPPTQKSDSFSTKF